MKKLRKQGYHFVGKHSAVKPCLWLRKSLRGEGSCYKHKFYGIASHRCIQMTPTLKCNHRCLHCWRPIEMQVPEVEWDSPELIVQGAIEMQRKLLTGYKGSEKTDLAKLKEAMEPKHAAISLAGEPTLYPYLKELVEEFHKHNFTTFVVTNGTNPELIAKLQPSQLYVSINAPDEVIYKKVCNPLGETWSKWSEINETLELLPELSTRTTIRITLTRGLNMFNPESYGKLIAKAEPDYVEVKAYMHLGFSRKRLERSAMPSHSEIADFANKIAVEMNYKIADESEISRVVVLSRDGKLERLI
ncbi:MAG: 4-demethylwyosine synthase TYW1 [Halobacteria archaeon]